MAMNPEDLKLRDGARAPGIRSATTKNRASAEARWGTLKRFDDSALGNVMAGFGVPKVRTR